MWPNSYKRSTTILTLQYKQFSSEDDSIIVNYVYKIGHGLALVLKAPMANLIKSLQA